MALPNFPDSPTIGQEITVGAATYQCVALTPKPQWRLVNQADKGLRSELGNYFRTFDTVADMKNAVSSLWVGRRVQWLGYYAASDGGSGWGIVKTGAHTNDGGKIISVSPSVYVEQELGSSPSVLKFGAIRGTTRTPSIASTNKTAFQNAHLASKSVKIVSGEYWFGTYQFTDTIINLTTCGEGIDIKTVGAVELVCETTGEGAEPHFYRLSEGNSKFRCGHIRFRDLGYNPMVTRQGAVGFFLINTPTGNWGDIYIKSIYAKNLVCPIFIVDPIPNNTNRIRGITIGQIFSDDCYYGFNSQNQGDGVRIGKLIAFRNWRPYFVFGVDDHEVSIYNRQNRNTTGAVNICRQVGGGNTRGIKVSYVARDQDQTITHVLINHIDLLGGEISNVDLNIDIKSSVPYFPLRFVNYSASGGSETTAASTNVIRDIDISGSCDENAAPISVVGSYPAKGFVRLLQGRGLTTDPTLLDKFSLSFQRRNDSVVWGAASVAPSLGNGNLFRTVDVAEGICHCTFTLDIGSTTTTGTGSWTFSLPYQAKTSAVGSAWLLDAGTAHYVGVTKIQPGAFSCEVFTNGAVAPIQSNIPFTWVAGDKLLASISYPIS